MTFLHCLPRHTFTYYFPPSEQTVKMLRNPVTWLIVGLSFFGVCALETLDVDTRRRLVDIFGNPADLLDVDTVPANGTDCICLPYSRCKLSNDSFYGTEDSQARHMSCVNIFDWCCEPSRVRMKRPLRVGCGWSGGDIGSKAGDNTSRAGDKRIKVGDANDTAAFGEFPWVVAILHISAGATWTQHEYIGAGSIINLAVVLTAAHKVDGLDHTQLKCRAGEWNSHSIAEPLIHQDRRILKITQHEGYARRHVANSVALLLLKTPFISSPHISAGCVARAPPTGACAGTGWGRRRHASENYSKVLKKVVVPIVDDANCTAELRETHLGRSFSLHASQLCAGARGADTCTGDGGAPLVCAIGSSGQRYAIFGMAAWGVGCGERPAVYVKVSKFHGWLGDVLEANGLDSSSYQFE